MFTNKFDQKRKENEIYLNIKKKKNSKKIDNSSQI